MVGRREEGIYGFQRYTIHDRILIHYCIINFNLSLFIFQLEIKHILNVNFVSIDERN